MKLLFIALICISSVALGQTPFSYNRAQTIGNSTRYYSYGRYIGRSYSVGNSTYWNRNGVTLGRSFSVPGGSTYYKSFNSYNTYPNTYPNTNLYNRNK